MEPPLADRIARHGDLLRSGGRTPLYVELMAGAAADVASGGVVADVFDGLQQDRGSVPALRLMAALHHLVLEGSAPELAAYFPDAGGTLAPHGAWPVAQRTIAEHFELVRRRTALPVQTNDPGRSVALYGALLWLTERHPLPVRLREIGASSGLNLIPDRYAYFTAGLILGDRDSPVRFPEPWHGAPAADLEAAAQRLRIADRGGCDVNPIDLSSDEGQRRAISYMWPDEPERLERMRRAIDLYLEDPPPVAAEPASQWLSHGAGASQPGALTVVWQSVVRQYLPATEAQAVGDRLREAGQDAGANNPLAWVTLEMGAATGDRRAPFELACTVWPAGERVVLASAGFHGAPVNWAAQPA